MPNLDISIVNSKLYELNVNKFEEQKNKEHLAKVAHLLKKNEFSWPRKKAQLKKLEKVPSLQPKQKLV